MTESKNLTHSANNRADFASESGETLEIPVRLFQFKNIRRLEQTIAQQRTTAAILTEPLRIEQLEMLEAELINQDILAASFADSAYLAARAFHEITLLKWKARRLGVRPDSIQFMVDVPRYVLSRANQLLPLVGEQAQSANIWSARGAQAATVEEELRYLDQFAAYLTGAYAQSDNAYQRGLTLLLSVISSTKTESKRGSKIFILPASKEDFVNTLKGI